MVMVIGMRMKRLLRGWTIIIDDGEGTRSTVTDGDGHYSFDVSPGIWTVSEEGQSGWQQTGLRINGEDQKSLIQHYLIVCLKSVM